MSLLTIFGAPVAIIIGFPILIFAITAISEARKFGWANIQWKYPIGYGAASLVALILLALLGQ